MKKIIFLFLLVWSFGFGQTHLVGNANYFLETDMSLGQGYYGGPCGYGGLVWFHVTKAQGQQIFYKDNPGTYANTWDQMDRTFDKISFNESYCLLKIPLKLGMFNWVFIVVTVSEHEVFNRLRTRKAVFKTFFRIEKGCSANQYIKNTIAD